MYDLTLLVSEMMSFHETYFVNPGVFSASSHEYCDFENSKRSNLLTFELMVVFSAQFL
jgi:hypothetical protein